MKILKSLLLVGLLGIFTIGSANAQTIEEKFDTYATIGFECDGVYDWADGPMVFHSLYHVNDQGMVDWYKLQVQAKELVSYSTGEKFKLSYASKDDAFDLGGILTTSVHFNLVGNMGTHLIYSQVWEIDTNTWIWTLISEKAKCL